MTLAARAATKIVDLTPKICAIMADTVQEFAKLVPSNAACFGQPEKAPLRCRMERGDATSLLKDG